MNTQITPICSPVSADVENTLVEIERFLEHASRNNIYGCSFDFVLNCAKYSDENKFLLEITNCPFNIMDKRFILSPFNRQNGIHQLGSIYSEEANLLRNNVNRDVTRLALESGCFVKVRFATCLEIAGRENHLE